MGSAHLERVEILSRAGRPQCPDGEQKRDDTIWGRGVAWVRAPTRRPPARSVRRFPCEVRA